MSEAGVITTTDGVVLAEENATASTFSLSSAFKGLAASLGITTTALGVITGALAALAVGTIAYKKWAEYQEEIRQSAYDAATAIEGQTKSVDEYVERYKELQTALQNAKGDEEATYSVKQDLLSLQTELNEAFGDEYGKLNLVTDAYKDQTEAIKAYKKEIAQNFLNEQDAGIKAATKKMTENNHYNLTYGGESIDNDKGKILKEIADNYLGRGVTVMDEAGDGSYARFSIHLSANAEDAYQTISDFMNDVREKATELGNEDLFADVLEISSQSLNNSKNIIDDYGEIYKKALVAEIAVDNNLSVRYTEATSAVEKYNEALLRSEDPYSDENVKSAWDNLQTVKQGISENTDEWGKYESVMTDVFDQANDSIYSFYQTMQNDDSISKLVDDLQGLEDTDLQAMANDGVEDSFDKLCQKANEYGLEIQDVIDLLLQLGVAQGKVEESAPDETSISFTDIFSSLPIDKLEEYIALVKSGAIDENTISSYEELATAMDKTGTSAEDAIKAIKEFAEANPSSIELTKNIQESYDVLESVKEEFKNTKHISLDTLSSIANMYPELTTATSQYAQGLITEQDLIYQLEQAYQSDVDAYRTAMVNKLSYDENFFNNVVNHNESLFSNLAKAYGTDIKNWKSLAQAKKDIDQGLIQNLGKAWGKYYGVVIDSVTGMASLVNKTPTTGLTAKESVDLIVARTNAEAMVNSANQAKKAMEEASKIQVDIPDFGGIGTTKKTGSSGGSGSGSNSKQTIDWIERKLTVLQNKLSELKAAFENAFTLKDKKNNLNKQITLTKNLLTTTTKAAERYLKAANKVGLSDSLKKKVQNGSYDITEYSSETAEKIQSYENYYDKYKELKQQSDELETDIRNLRTDRYQLYVDDAEAKIAKSQALAALDEGNYKKQNKHLEGQKKYLQESYEAQIKIAEEEKDAFKVTQLRAELAQQLRDIEKEEFDNVVSTYEYKIGHIKNQLDDLTNAISDVENRGLIADSTFYTAQIDVQNKIKDQLETEHQKLKEQLKDIEDFTPAWYQALNSIQDVENEIASTNSTIKELQNSINGVANTLSGNILDSFRDLNNEADTLITLLGDNLSDDKLGNLTKEGIAALGLYNQQMNVSKASAERVQNEINSIQKAIDNGTYGNFVDSNGMLRTFASTYEAEDRIKELYSTYRSEIQNTYQYESKIVDLMKQKYQSELNYVKELIDQKKEQLSAEQDLYQYSRDIKTQVDGINSIKKQLSALSGDNSLENQSKIQKLNKQLKDQEEELQNKQYERYISDTQNMLDNLSKEYSDLIESVSKDRDTLLKESNQLISSNGAEIQQTITETASEYGMQLTDNMQSATANITTGLSGIKTVLDGIAEHVAKRIVDDEGNTHDINAGGAKNDAISKLLSSGTNTKPKSTLTRAISEAYGVGLNLQQIADLSRLLGLNYELKDFTNESPIHNQAKLDILNELEERKYLKKSGNSYIRGYAGGGVISSVANAIRLNGDKVLISGKPGERMLTEKQNENFEKFTDALPDLVNLTDIIKPNVNVPTAIDRNIGGITYGGNNQINIELPNVTNYEDFMRKFQNDPKAEQLVQHMTASALNGSRLGKNTIRF